MTFLGILVGLLACELALRPFAVGLADLPVPSKEYRPSRNLATPGKETRQYLEGIASAHFAYDGARLTGHEPLDGAPTGLILGDSFVEAKQVEDTVTLGAVIERLSRSEGHPLNVRQYGWSGGSIPSYLALADTMVKELRPSWVTIVLNNDDLGTSGLKTGQYYRMEIQPGGSYKLIELERTAEKLEPVLSKFGLTSEGLRRSMVFSTLAFLCIQRFQLIMGSANSAPPPSKVKSSEEAEAETAKKRTEDKVATQVSVQALKAAYGDSLLIVYVPDIEVTSTSQPDDLEVMLLEVCREASIKCLSMRGAMLAERDNNYRLSQGFSNTTLGEGHLNEDGHRVVGSEIWRAVSSPDAPQISAK